jgi:DNA-binding PadR family transcriptional regulator
MNKSSVDLTLLGLLIEKPRNPYELAHFIQTRYLDKLLKISQPAVYKNCKKLFQSGFLDGKTMREGELPEKVTYSVNKKGEMHFKQLMNHFNEIKPFYFEHNSFIWNLDKMDNNESRAMLKNLHSSFVTLRDLLIGHEKEVALSYGFGVKALVKQYRMVMETLVNWVEGIAKDYTDSTKDLMKSKEKKI